MEASTDRLLKRVWLINGLLLLVLAALGLGAMLFALGSELWPDAETAVRAPGRGQPADATVPRAIRYGAPEPIRGTAARLVTVHHGEADQPMEGYFDSSGGYATTTPQHHYGPEGPLVNVIFLVPGAEQGRLLLDRPAYIKDLNYPSPARGGAGAAPAVPDPQPDPPQTWISYEIVDRATNGDGRLNREDRAGLFVSALDGSGLRRIVPEPFWILTHSPTGDGRGIVVLALEPPKGKASVPREQMRQRAFIYDLASGTLRPYAALESAASRAARVVGR